MNTLLLSAGELLDAAEPVVLWTTVGILAALVFFNVIIYFAKKDISLRIAKYSLFTFVIYALVVGIFMLSLKIAKYYGADGKYNGEPVAAYVFIPILVTLALVLIAAIAGFVIAKKSPSALKKFGSIAGIVCGLAVIITLVLIAVFFKNNIKGDGYYDGYGKLNGAALYISAAILVVGSLVVAFIIDRKGNFVFDTRALAFAGITVSLSFALSYVKLWEMPQGGSVTLFSMLPIMLFSYVYGAKKGMLIGFIYGMLQAVQDPYIIHPAQFLLDYPVAFALTGFAGALKDVKVLDKIPQLKFALSALIGGMLRFVAHVLSGVFAFGAYALDAGQSNFLAYSAAYNSFVFVDLALVIVAGIIVFSSKAFVKETKRFAGITETEMTAENAETSEK